jgi:murein L,D-transpeptidase YafK
VLKAVRRQALQSTPREHGFLLRAAVVGGLLGALLVAPSLGEAKTPAATPGLSASDAQSEARLLDIYLLMARGDSRDALTKAEKLVRDQPNFQLAQLVYGDLLAARTRTLQSLGDIPEASARGGASALLDLKEESLRRVTALNDRPQPGTVPSQFLKIAPQTRHAIAIDASRSRLYLFENTASGLQLKSDYYVSIGKAGTLKNQEGDQRTPLGVYFITSNLDTKALNDFYGAGALPLNYPNMLDQRRGKSGSGIWLHGTPPQQYSRAPRSTDGCLVLSNPDLLAIIHGIAARNTPVVVASQLVWKPVSQLEDPARSFQSTLNAWRSSKVSGDMKKILTFYTPDFSSAGKSLDQYTPLLKSELKALKGRDLELKNLSYLQWNDSAETMVVSFGEVAKGQRSGIHKRQYWIRSNKEWKIFFEGVH